MKKIAKVKVKIPARGRSLVMEDGHLLQKCCKCPETRTIHRDHSGGFVN